MTTIRDVVTRAARKAGMGADVSGAEATAGLNDLNDMFAAWKLDGIDIWGDDTANDDFPDVATDHAAYAMDDAFPMPNAFIEGTVYLLASRMAQDYQFPVAFDPDSFLRKVQAHYTKIPVAAIDEALWRPRRWVY